MRNLLQKFLELEAASGIVLLAATVIAMILANSPFAYLHKQFVDASLFTINDGLMVVFFFIVGLELKRELLSGALMKKSQALLPAVGALGGMIVPALLYIAITYPNPDLLKGWATPVATDIAFALGVLSLFGKRVPSALKVFLLALAIFDDIGAIIIITLFYSSHVSYLLLLAALLITFLLILLNRFAVQAMLPYLLLGVLLWCALLPSGVHPTIAGVILALTIPNNQQQLSLEDDLHPWVAYLIMPLFALANAGVSFGYLSLKCLLDPIVLGITLGLFLGKQIGVMGFSWLLIRLKWAQLPKKTNWLGFYGVALICGIGFTMSLFLGTLSFQHNHMYLAEVRLGVIMGSFLSGVFGTLVLFSAFGRKQK